MSCALNRSKSKETHLFPQAKRFAESRTPQYASRHVVAKRIRMTWVRPWSPPLLCSPNQPSSPKTIASSPIGQSLLRLTLTITVASLISTPPSNAELHSGMSRNWEEWIKWTRQDQAPTNRHTILKRSCHTQWETDWTRKITARYLWDNKEIRAGTVSGRWLQLGCAVHSSALQV